MRSSHSKNVVFGHVSEVLQYLSHPYLFLYPFFVAQIFEIFPMTEKANKFSYLIVKREKYLPDAVRSYFVAVVM